MTAILTLLSAAVAKFAAVWWWTWIRPERILLLGGSIVVWLGITIMYWPAGLVVLGLVMIYFAAIAAGARRDDP